MPKKASAQSASGHPWTRAIAFTPTFFSSSKVAVYERQLVHLEFTPSMVVVHDPKQPTKTNPLGIILYSHVFCGVKSKNHSSESARKTGQVDDDTYYLLLEIDATGKTPECKFCGKRWQVYLEHEAIEHLQEHENAA